ncbi:MAG: T9SS type A sorting domain-containing protein [Saprospiraceae bacterium]|nr:T9SS type A sorting domain-containing protein [Saprospiraceae bacterium]MBK8297545.1 T9SS type A sorting domain-containing protein [Saprospiraceae bacterium]
MQFCNDDSKVFEIFDIFGRSIYKSQETIGDELIRYLQIPSGIYFIKNLNNVRKIYKN